MSKPIEIRPALGGRLMTSPSADSAGLLNYTVKRDVRRVLDQEVLAEGEEWFCPDPEAMDLYSPLPWRVANEPITLIALARQQNGRTAIVAGTATTLYRFYGMTNGTYFLGSGFEQIAYIEDGYFIEDYGAWVVIGTGFSPSGQRWEAVSNNGYLVLNNGVDLPVTYRAEQLAVQPIWELREQGVASVGTIGVHKNVLYCGDIRQINSERHVELMTPIRAAASASQEGVTRMAALGSIVGNILTLTVPDPELVQGATIRMANGLGRTVVSVDSPTTATLDGEAEDVGPAQPVYVTHANDFRIDQVASVLFPSITPADLVGLTLIWDNGEERTIMSVVDGVITVDRDGPIPAHGCAVENPAAYKSFTEETYLERYHWRVVWAMPRQPRRWGAIIPCTVHPDSNIIRLKYPVRSLENGQEILIVGGDVNGGNLTCTVIWRTAMSVVVGGSAVVQAGQVVQAAIEAANAAVLTAMQQSISTNFTLEAAEDALEHAKLVSNLDPIDAEKKQAVADASAAVDTAREAANQAVADLTAAQGALTKAQAEIKPYDLQLTAADAYESITGLFEDLEDDGSGILKMLTLRDLLVVYKTTSIFLGQYTGNVERPIVFQRVPIMEGTALVYRNTLIALGETGHIYAGATEFYRFDLTNRVPMVVPELQLCKNVFFGACRPALGNQIFAANNALTQEIFFCFPGTGPDKALRFDYRTGTVSTTAAAYTAAGMVHIDRWGSGGPLPGDDWFLMGVTDGSILRYGLMAGDALPSGTIKARRDGSDILADGDFFTVEMVGKSILMADGRLFAITNYVDPRQVILFGDGEDFGPQSFQILPAIYHRCLEPYDGVLQTGADSIGNANIEKRTSEYILLLGSASPDHPLQVAFRGGVNPGAVADILTTNIAKPITNNYVPVTVQQYYLGLRVTASGVNHLVKIAAQFLTVQGVNSKSFLRRPNV